MSSSFVLELDTTAPSVSYGQATGAGPGQTLTVPYSSNEPIARAVLHLSTGDLELDVSQATLSVALPADAAGGPADITAYDALGNGARAVGVVTISVEVPVVKPPVLGGGWRPYRKQRLELEPIELEGAVLLEVGASGSCELIGDAEEEILILSL